MWATPLGNVRRVLCLGAHSDDIEIGLGGTLLTLMQQNPDLEVYWVVFCAPGPRTQEAQASADEFLAPLRRKTVRIGTFRESYFPTEWAAIKDWYEEIKRTYDPDVVFTHYRTDRHQDHRVLSDLAWNTFRHHLILEYEILKYDGDVGTPNVFMPLAPEVCERKIDLLMKHFSTQRSKHWFTRESFSAMHRIRGIECASPTGFAEAFYGRKLTIGARPA